MLPVGVITFDLGEPFGLRGEQLRDGEEAPAQKHPSTRPLEPKQPSAWLACGAGGVPDRLPLVQ